MKEFGEEALDVVSQRDPETTGNFEIRVAGELVHSKKTKGHGFLGDDAAQQKAVLDAVRKALAAE